MSFSVTRPRAALVALAMLSGLLVPVTLSAEPASAALVPSTELLVNGSFESGDFTGWETKDMADPFAALAVSPVGFSLPSLVIAPTDGTYAVGHGFDGGGPDTIEFWQEVAIPAGQSADISFDWRAVWNQSPGSLPRTFDVIVEPAGGGSALLTENVYTTSPDPFLDTIGDTGPATGAVDLSEFVGSTIRVKFLANIPENYTGPASMQIDNVSLTATGDTEAPVITLTGDNPQTVEVFSSYIELGATMSDNVDADVALDGNFTAVILDVLGEYPVTYDATDSSGNAADQVIRTVEVVDTEAPVISLVGGTVTVGLGSVYEDPGASAVDNYDTDLEVNINTGAVVTSEIGSYDVTFDVSDSSGNAATQLLRTVNVVDTTSPIITLIGGTQFIEFPAAYTERGATVSDNYDTDLEIMINSTAVNTLALGVYRVTYDATDSSGNAATQVLRTVRVVDTTRPVITLTGDDPQIIEVDGEYVELGATATDNHDTDLMVYPDASDVETSIVGSYTVFYTVTDAQGNTAVTVERTVNVVDTEAPVITIVGADPQEIEVGDAYTELGTTVTDNYDTGLTATPDLSGLLIDTVGSYTVTYNAVDAGGNAALPVTRTVNVVDTEAPVLVLTGDPIVTVEVFGDYSEAGATATDNYDTALDVAIDSDLDTTVVGEYTVTYTVSDSSDNAATPVTRTVNVVDTESPVITLIGGTPDGTQTIGVFRPYLELGSTVSDNYDTDLVAAVDTTGLNTAVVGSYTVWYTAIDSSDNLADPVARTVNVIDDGFPVITLLGDAEVTIEVGSVYDDEGAVADDVADGPLTGSIIVGGPVDPDVVAVYTVTYNVTDSDDNAAAQVTRTVNVVDTTPPVITLLGANPQDIEVGGDYVELGSIVSDNYDIGLEATVNTDGVLLDTVGEYTVTYNAIDANSNEADQVTRTVNVVDTTPPVITLLGANPQDIEVGGDYVELGSTVSDNYDIGLEATVNTDGVLLDTVGEYTVTYNAIDANSNEADQVTRTVNVVDTTPPVITLLGANPQDIEVGGDYVELGSTVSDNYDIGLEATVNTDGVLLDTVGEYTVTYNAIDANDNPADQVTRTVNVVDTTPPVITLTGASPVTIEVGSSYADAGATASDIGDGDLTGEIITINPVKTDVIGEYTVTYNVTDSSLNAAVQVTRTVNVVDTTVPVITRIGANPVTIEVGSSYTDAGATASDIGDGDLTGAIVTINPVNADVVGVYTVRYNVTDASLNKAVQVTRTVNVVDTTAPLVTVIGAKTVTVEVGSAYVDAGATAVDLVDGDLSGSIVATNPVKTKVVGVYVIEYDVSDSHGNPAKTVTRTVIVVDTTVPVITLVGDNPQVIELGSAYVELGATATDNYDLGTTGIKIDAKAVNTSKAGSYTVTYDVTDANLNAAVTVERTVSVVKAFETNIFSDDDGSVFEGDIDWLANSGITLGCNPPLNSLFCPDAPVTRGQMAAFLHRALPNLPEVRSAIDFADDNGSAFEADIEWLYSRGITSGTSATTFSPGTTVSRGQMAAFLHRALPNLPEVRSAIDFADDNNSIFEDDIEWLYSRGITQGTSATTFAPDGPVTRGQMAAFLHRALG